MRVLLTTLNSKFIHSNLAIRYLKASCWNLEADFVMDEFTINDNLDDVIGGIYRHNPDIVALSCYIWNIGETLMIIESLKKVMPQCIIILGGPEVSFDSQSLMKENPSIDIILRGEGEITFPLLIENLISDKSLEDIRGITYRNGESIVENEDREPIRDLDTIPYPYEDGFHGLENKIIYYETTRGCPFNCQYCLSSISHGVRFFSLDRVKRDLQAFIDAKIPQVKLVDRTFNCNPKRARDIFRMIMDMGGSTNFHFEICGDLLDEETLELLKDAPPGLFQFEIGVQSTREDTLEAIKRRTDFERLTNAVSRLQRFRNIHLHLDLIAGLPGEDYLSFKKSFNDVYDLRPDRLQLGFLKLLKGSGIRENRDSWGYEFSSYPPYEVLKNRDMTYGEILKLKDVEDLVEKYYNTHRFEKSLDYLAALFDMDYFGLYESFAEFWRIKGYFGLSHSLIRQYEILMDFGLGLEGVNEEFFKDLVKWDYVSQQRPSRYPKGIEVELEEEKKQWVREFFNNPGNISKYLPHLKDYTPSQISRMGHIEFFDYDVTKSRDLKSITQNPTVLLFDYNIPNKLFSKSRDHKLDFI